MNIKEILKKLSNIQKRFPVLIILLILTISLFFFYYALQLETDSNFDVMFSDDSDTMIHKEMVNSDFGGTELLFAYAKVNSDVNAKGGINDIRDPDVINAMKALKENLEKETYVTSVSYIGDIFNSIYGKLPDTLEESKFMIDQLPEDVKKQYLSRFISEDYQYQSLFITINLKEQPGYLERIEGNIKEKINMTPFPIGVTADVAGQPILMNNIMNFLINDNAKTVILAVIGIFIILWIYFKSWKVAILSTIPVILTLVWLAGTLYLLDIKITVMIASVGAMMVGMSVDYAIHLTHTFHERVKEGDKNPIYDTVVSVGSALFASVATTIAGFLAMLLGSTPNSLTQGKVLSLGIFYAFFITMIILPPIMILQRKYLYTKLDHAMFRLRGKKEKQKKNVIDIFLNKLAHLQVRKPKWVLGIILGITLFLIPGFFFVYLDVDDENWMPEGNSAVEGLYDINYNFGGTDSVSLLFTLDNDKVFEIDDKPIEDLRDSIFLKQLRNLDNTVKKLDWVTTIDSPSQIMIEENQGRIPYNNEKIKEIINQNPRLRSRFNKDFSTIMYTINSEHIKQEELNELMDEVESLTFIDGIKIIPYGNVVQQAEMQKMMGKDTVFTTVVGFIFVILLASLFYRSIISGLLAFFPIIFAIIWTIGTMGFINLPFTVLTTGMLAMLMGMGIDFSIHLIHSIEEGIKKPHATLEKVIPATLKDTGRAIAVTTITTIFGFMALSFATLVNTKRLGWTLGLGIIATFFACMLIVPTVLVIKYRLRNKKRIKNLQGVHS